MLRRRRNPERAAPRPGRTPRETDDLDDETIGPEDDDTIKSIDDEPELEEPTAAAPPKVRTFPERRCSVKRCLKKFIPTHQAQKFCPACRGHRVDDSGAAPKTDSWWTNTTSRDDFQKRAKDQEDRLKGSKEKFAVPNRILN